MKNAILILLLFAWIKASGQSQTRKVLFLGNSYTYVNDLPQIVSALAANMGDVLLYDSHLPGGYTLQEHASSPVSQNKISAGNWDYIVLQEQSQRPAFTNPGGFMDGFNNLKNFIKQNQPCAQLTSFMTWGYKNGDVQNCPTNPNVCTYDGMQNLVTNRYMSMSELYESEVTPVGVVWKYIKENHPAINLYHPDGSHPSFAGSYIAACCFYTSLFRKNPALISNNYGLDANTASIIRNATKSLVFDQLSNWYIGKYVPASSFKYSIGNGFNEVLLHGNTSAYRDSFRWDFGDGSTSTVINPAHSYAADGAYTIKLTSYKCYLGQIQESIFERTVNFCAHTNTIYPDLLLCPDATDTLWTQPAASYQWYYRYDSLITGATNQFLLVRPGATYCVSTTVNGCTEISPQMFIDVYINNPDCVVNINDLGKFAPAIIFPNPVQNILTIQNPQTIEAAFVYDLSGKKMPIYQLTTSTYDITGLSKGMYILKLNLKNGQSKSAKFIKQ